MGPPYLSRFSTDIPDLRVTSRKTGPFGFDPLVGSGVERRPLRTSVWTSGNVGDSVEFFWRDLEGLVTSDSECGSWRTDQWP